MNPDQRRAAQQRLERIARFREELSALEQEEALALTPEQQTRLEAHLEALTQRLAREHGLDATESGRRLSWGMRLTALLGGVALCAALVLLGHRMWGLLPTSGQVALLGGAPLVLLGAAAWSSRCRMDPFFTTLLALAAGAAFVLDLNTVGVVFNSPGSPHALLAFALFALLVGYGLPSRLLLAAGLLLVCAYASALGQQLSGGWWAAFIEHPAFMIPAAALAYLGPSLARGPDPQRFAVVFRGCGAGAGLFALLIASFAEHLCCHGLSLEAAETTAQLLGLGLAAAVVYHGLRLGEASTSNLGALAFVAFLYARLHAWCWEWMPKYAFFFLVGFLALGLLMVFRRLRQRAALASTANVRLRTP